MPDRLEYTSPEFVCAHCGVAIRVQINFRYERLEMRCPKCRRGRVETSGSVAAAAAETGEQLTNDELLAAARARHPDAAIEIHINTADFLYRMGHLLITVNGVRAAVALWQDPPDNLRWEGVLLEGDTYADKVLQAVDLAVEYCKQHRSAR